MEHPWRGEAVRKLCISLRRITRCTGLCNLGFRIFLAFPSAAGAQHCCTFSFLRRLSRSRAVGKSSPAICMSYLQNHMHPVAVSLVFTEVAVGTDVAARNRTYSPDMQVAVSECGGLWKWDLKSSWRRKMHQHWHVRSEVLRHLRLSFAWPLIQIASELFRVQTTVKLATPRRYSLLLSWTSASVRTCKRFWCFRAGMRVRRGETQRCSVKNPQGKPALGQQTSRLLYR